jgi:hypothetical protein
MSEDKLTCKIHCCECNAKVAARLTNGREMYPHRTDLASLPFWVCDACHNFVGCHHKTANRTKPLGCIPTVELKKLRQEIHRAIDPLWKSKMISRNRLYARLSKILGRQYHTADIRTVNEAKLILTAAKQIKVDMK